MYVKLQKGPFIYIALRFIYLLTQFKPENVFFRAVANETGAFFFLINGNFCIFFLICLMRILFTFYDYI